MTPKKNIVRKPTYIMPDGTPVTAWSLGPGFTLKETAFILWYTFPGTEAFHNSGRAAARAGYKGNAVMQGYLLKQKPRIAQKINDLLIPVKMMLDDFMWKSLYFCAERMFFDITDFYRGCKETVKINGVEREVDGVEVIPLHELSRRNQMCVDGIIIKTVRGRDKILYKLPDRTKEFRLFMKIYDELMPEKKSGGPDWKATAEIIREDAVKARPTPHQSRTNIMLKPHQSRDGAAPRTAF